MHILSSWEVHHHILLKSLCYISAYHFVYNLNPVVLLEQSITDIGIGILQYSPYLFSVTKFISFLPIICVYNIKQITFLMLHIGIDIGIQQYHWCLFWAAEWHMTYYYGISGLFLPIIFVYNIKQITFLMLHIGIDIGILQYHQSLFWAAEWRMTHCFGFFSLILPIFFFTI